MKAVVTEGAGLIGSTLVDQLLMEGHEVVALDDLNDDHSKSVHFHQPPLGKADFRFEAVDLLDPNRLRGFFVDADVVFHLAGHATSETPADEIAKDNLINTTGTLNVLLAAKNAGVRRVISSSSSAVYGKATSLPVKETDATTIASSGAKIALANEEYCRLFNDIYSLQTVSLRFFTLYGPRQRPGMEISMMTERALKGQSPRIRGDGKRPVDLTFISDAVDAIRRCADCPDLKGRPLNICSGGTTTMNQIAIAIQEAASRPGGEPEWLPELPDDTIQILGDNTLAKELLGWEPKVPIEQGIAEFVEWYKMNRSPIV